MTGAAEPARRATAAVAALVAAVVVAAWLPSLSWGLWLDETSTAWQAATAWARGPGAVADPAQSPLFGFIQALFYFPGSPHMEAWLRVPALLGALASCWLVYRLAELIVGRGTGLYAMLALIGSPQLTGYATQARPYTLALAACLAMLWGFLRWLETGWPRHGLVFALAFAASVHLHMLFGAFALVPAFLLVRRLRRGMPVRWLALAGWLALSALLLAPLVPRFLALSHFPDQSALPPPRLPDLADALVPWTVLLSLVAFLLLLIPLRRRAFEGLADPSNGVAAARPVLTLATFWFFVPPLLLFVVSRVTHRTVLIDRYFLHTLAAQALVVALLFRALRPALATVALLACFLPYPIVYGIQTRARADSLLSWRAPLADVRALDPTGSAPVFVQSGHAATNALDWQHGIEQRGYFYSQLSAYPIPNRAFPLPYAVDDSERDYVRRLADTELSGAPLIFVAGLSEHPNLKWMQQFFEARGYTNTRPVHKGLWLLVLRKTTPGS